VTAAHDIIRALLPLADPQDGTDQSNAIRRVLHRWLASGSSWEHLAGEAEYHGVTPLLAPMIVGFDAATTDARRMFAALASRHRRASEAREACIETLLTQFATAGMPLLLLKGAALSHTLYSAPHLRAALDIDILIEPENEQRAVDLVRDLGYVFAHGHGSKFAGRLHHLPVAMRRESGIAVALELHRRAMHPDQRRDLTLRSAARPLQVIARGAGSPGLAFGHVDMLDHLSRHAFEPAHRLRLVHLYDLWRYRVRFRDVVDWAALVRSHPQVIVVQRLVGQLFGGAETAHHASSVPVGAGLGMLPLSQIAATNAGWTAKLGKLLNPPAWWLHGYYGVPLERSLVVCRAVRHPATLVRWMSRRLITRIGSAAGFARFDTGIP
jgi:hypothetical protein